MGTTILPGATLCNERLATIDALEEAGTMEIVIDE
jgi:hypothetical protein